MNVDNADLVTAALRCFPCLRCVECLETRLGYDYDFIFQIRQELVTCIGDIMHLHMSLAVSEWPISSSEQIRTERLAVSYTVLQRQRVTR